MKKISIIIATFNAGKTIKRCLNSIVSQLNNITELIVIDGGSYDNTNDILQQYCQYLSSYISEPDNGIYDAWNKGIKLAKGDWIMFVGADDVLLPGAIDYYLKVLDTTPNIGSYDYISARNEYVDENDHILNVYGESTEWKHIRYVMRAAHVASLHNKANLFNTIGCFDINFKICADYDLLLRKRDKFRSIYIADRLIARMQTGGMSFSVNAILETYRVRKKNKSLPLVLNCLRTIYDYLIFKTYKFRHRK